MTTTGANSIIDIHCHIASELFFPRSFLDGVVDNMIATLQSRGMTPNRTKIAGLYSSIMQDPLCDALVREMDDAGIQQSVLQLADFTFALRDSRITVAEMVDHHKRVLDRYPDRLRVFAGVDPRWGQDGVALFEKAIRDYRFHGFKLYPPCGYTPADRTLYPYYEICAQNGLPVLVHIGATSPVLSFEEAQPIYVDRAARDFPRVNFVLAHGSVHYRDECAMLCINRPNVFLDVSGYATIDVCQLRPLFQRGINHKILFGTDWPIFRLQGNQRDLVRRLTGDSPAMPESMLDRDRQMFFSGNAARLLSQVRAAESRPAAVGVAPSTSSGQAPIGVSTAST